jgi:hypothetical protein
VRTRSTAGLAVTLFGLLASAGMAQGITPVRHAAEFRASTFTASAQEDAALAVAPDGSFAVVWASRRQQQGRYGVYLQRFDRAGVAIGQETPLNLWTTSQATAPVVAAGSDGGAWAAWQSHRQDGSRGAVIARRFGADGADGAGGSEILVNERTEGEQITPVLAALPDGGAVVAWSTTLPGEPERVAVRVLNTDGSARTGEALLDATPGVRTATPSVAAGDDGSFAVAYGAFAADGSRMLGVRVQAFDARGNPVGAAQQVSAPGALTPVEPVIAATAGGFVVAWHDVPQPDGNYDILASLLDASGAPVGATVMVNNSRLGLQNGAAVAVAPDGSITVAFNDHDEHGLGVFAREFDSALRPLGEQHRLNIHAAGDQQLRQSLGTQRLAFAPDGTLLCAWQGDAGFGDSSAVHVTLLSPSPIDLGARTAGVTPAMQPASFGGGIALAGGPEPHEPPTFDPRDIDTAEREITVTDGAIGFTGVINTGWTPPDPHMAVGPNHVVVMTNGEIGFFTKAGVQTFADEIEDAFGFWGSVGATGFVFDPEVIYDTTSGRFFAMAAEGYGPGNTSYCLVAVSDDSDPNGTWHKYRFSTTALAGNLFDSPNIGVTDNALVITGDGFGIGSNYPVYIFDKAPLLVGNPPTITNSFLLTTSTQSAGYPRVSTGTGDTVYLMEHREANSGNTVVRVLAFRNILTSPTVSSFNLTVPAYGAPEDPPQLGTASRPNTFDARFWSVDIGPDGHLWGTHHINLDRVLARWYEVDLQGWPASGNNPVLVQSGNVDLGATVRTFFSSIHVSPDGSAAICYGRSSPTEYISMGSSYRLACDAAGTTPNNFIHQTSNAGYTSGRWGDYSAVQFDPADDNLYWGHHEYAVSQSWRTWVQSVVTGDCFCAGDFNHDGSANTVDVLAFLNAWNAHDPAADWNGDGSFNTLDVLAFLNDWNACQ